MRAACNPNPQEERKASRLRNIYMTQGGQKSADTVPAIRIQVRMKYRTDFRQKYSTFEIYCSNNQQSFAIYDHWVLS